MKQNINIEAEGDELVLKNKAGDYVIIPKKYRREVQDMIKENCHSCIDKLVETLPVMEDYAQDGSLYSEYLTPDPPTKKYPLDPNPNGSLPSYFKGSEENPIELNEVTVTAEAPEWLKYLREYVKNNPFNIDEYVENRFNNPVGREAIKKIDAESWKKELRQEGLEKRYNSAMDYVGEQLVKNKPQGELSRAEWLNQMTAKEEEIIKRNPKYQPSLWADTKRGLISLIELNPLQTFQNILNSSDYTNREKQEMLKDYADHPVMSKLGDAAKILNPLTIPSKMVQSTYKDDYSFTDALKGKKNNAGIVEDIVTDPLNFVGVGLVGKLSKADKVIDATKVGSKVLNKTDDVIKSTVYNEGENKILDFFTPKNTKKVSSEFTFENIPDRKFNTLNDFKTKYKSDYQVTTDKRTFKGEALDVTRTGKEESNYLTRNVDDKIEKHYNNEITLQKFKDYGGDEKSFQTLIDNINTPSKTVQGSLNNASGLLTDEGVSLAVHNKYLNPNETMQTLFHEKGHQSKIVASTKEESLLPNLWEDISKLSGYSKYTSADKGSIGMYMSHPSEIYSRIMELKYKANLKPYENFTKELLEKIGGVERDASGKITRMSGLMPSSYSKNEERWLKLINKAPVLIPAIGSGMYFQSQQQNKNKQ